MRLLGSAFGVSMFACIMLAIIWSTFGGVIKVYGPGLLGYDALGWKHGGAQTVYGVAVPKWAGVEGFAAGLTTPFRHHKLHLKEGETIVIDYDVEIDRGSISISVYRTHLSTLLQGVLVEDHDSRHLRKGARKGVITYTAPRDGVYQIRFNTWWDHEANKSAVIPLPDYEMVYDFRWRVE